MFVGFFLELRQAGVPVSLREYLTLMEGMQKGVPDYSTDDFYYFSRATLVKDERHLDRFDRVFGQHFKGLEQPAAGAEGETTTVTLPEEWLRRLAEKTLTDEEKSQIEALGGWDKLMETLRQRLAEQKDRHQGGSKWIGTAGTSPFGAYGYNPEGVRIGQDRSRNRRAIKVWDKREFRNLDDRLELGNRSMAVALRRLRRFARTGEASELDMPGTIGSTARNAGWLDLKMMPERHNAVRLLLFFDVGGSMDDHIRLCEELFTAARGAFKHLEYYYFHNCPYEGLWKDARRRHEVQVPVTDVLHTFDKRYRAIFVGDASMSPYELAVPGGSVEHWNREPGEVWLGRLLTAYPKAAWLNPVAESSWTYTRSIAMVATQMEGRMYPLTLDGLDRAMRALS